MFFWFTNNETFSIIDALMKLILVITGSALIICFCHKLTNFKKSRRYKYDLTRAAPPAASQANVTGHYNPAPNANQHRFNSTSTTTTTTTTAYDPYNTIRPFGATLGAGSSAYLNGQSFQVLLAPNLASAYGYHHPDAAAAAIQDLAALQSLETDERTLLNSGSHLPSGPALIGGAHTTTAPVGGQNTRIYSTSVQSDCSGFRAHQLEQQPEEECCPSYEEAIANRQPIGGDSGTQSSEPTTLIGARLAHNLDQNDARVEQEASS